MVWVVDSGCLIFNAWCLCRQFMAILPQRSLWCFRRFSNTWPTMGFILRKKKCLAKSPKGEEERELWLLVWQRNKWIERAFEGMWAHWTMNYKKARNVIYWLAQLRRAMNSTREQMWSSKESHANFYLSVLSDMMWRYVYEYKN